MRRGGGTVQAAAADKRAEVLHESGQIQAHLSVQDAALS